MSEGTLLLELQQNWLFLEAKRKEDSSESRMLAVEGLPSTDDIEQMVDREGRRCILFPSKGKGPEDHASQGVKILNYWAEVDGKTIHYIMVRCEAASLGKPFDHIAAQMIAEVISSPHDPGPACLRVLAQWRKLLKAVRLPEPDRSELVGALGEMVIAEQIIRYDPERRIDIWVGSDGQRHDFRRGKTALEVKTTTSNESKSVIIHGLDQLTAPDGGSLYVVFVRLEPVPSGSLSISVMLERICELGVPAEKVNLGLLTRGVPPGPWVDERFELRQTCVYPVDGQFPRIIPTMFTKGSTPSGVSEVRYRADLSVSDPPLDQDAQNVLFESLANE